MRKTLLFLAALAAPTVASAQTLTEVFVPQYMQGLNGTNSNRTPYVWQATLSGLTPNATYRYYSLAVNLTVPTVDAATTDGAGIPYFLTPAGFTFSTTGSMNTAGSYATFVTDATGSYTGWFGMAASGNARFTPGRAVNLRIMLNNGANGTTVATRLTTTSTVTVINYGTTSSATLGSFFWSNSSASPRNFVLLYDNVEGTGRPLAGAYVESDGIANTTANSNLAAYANNVEGVAGAWGTIIPNVNANGVRRIERRLPDGSIAPSAMRGPDVTNAPTAAHKAMAQVATDADGIWPGADNVEGTEDDVNTTNPTNGTTALQLPGDNASLPVELVSFTAAASGTDAVVRWSTASETNNAAFAIEALRGTAWTEVATVAGRGTTSERADYETRVSGLGTGRHTLRLVQRDLDGTATVAGTVELTIGQTAAFDVSVRGNATASPEVSFVARESGAAVTTVSDVTGRTVARYAVDAFAGARTGVTVADLAAGIYVVRIEGNRGSAATTLVVR